MLANGIDKYKRWNIFLKKSSKGLIDTRFFCKLYFIKNTKILAGSEGKKKEEYNGGASVGIKRTSCQVDERSSR